MLYIKFWRDLGSAAAIAAVCAGSALLSGCMSTDPNTRQVVVEDAKSRHQSSSSGNTIAVRSNGGTSAARSSTRTQAFREQPLGTTETPAGGTDYRVVQGDTLFSIAFRYGKSYQQLAQENGIEPPYNIKVGQVIHVGGAQSAASSSPETYSESYTVKKGDTLTSVAAAHNLPPSAIVRVNNLSYPYKLKVGDRLTLADPDASRGKSAQNATQKEVVVAGKPGTQQSESTVTPASEIKVVAGRTRTAGGVTWMWPAGGKVIKGFSLAENGNKGIDISGSRGQNVMSAADGQVVYSGSALRGYGKLIIINHSNEYLSAYAHNDELLVTEGQKIKRGQVIAKMGSTDASSVQLHFEIRYKGKSVNPLGYLPTK